MAKKETIIEEELGGTEFPEETTPATPRLQNDFQREDLNELRDVVNELWAERG